MISNNTSPAWKELHLHQKIRYLFEIVAIIGGLTILGLNILQLKLVNESNKINREMFNSTFPLEINTEIIDFKDKYPLIITLKITNIGNQGLYLTASFPKYMMGDSEEINEGFNKIKFKLFKEEEPENKKTDFVKEIQEVFIESKGSCILELTINFEIKNFMSKRDKELSVSMPRYETFVIIPVDLKGRTKQKSKVIYLGLLRDKYDKLLLEAFMYKGSYDSERNILGAKIKRCRIGDDDEFYDKILKK